MLTCGNVRLIHEARRKNLDKHNPFLVVSADRTVINGHNDIYNPTFVSFLIALMGDIEAAQRGEASAWTAK